MGFKSWRPPKVKLPKWFAAKRKADSTTLPTSLDTTSESEVSGVAAAPVEDKPATAGKDPNKGMLHKFKAWIPKMKNPWKTSTDTSRPRANTDPRRTSKLTFSDVRLFNIARHSTTSVKLP